MAPKIESVYVSYFRTAGGPNAKDSQRGWVAHMKNVIPVDSKDLVRFSRCKLEKDPWPVDEEDPKRVGPHYILARSRNYLKTKYFPTFPMEIEQAMFTGENILDLPVVQEYNATHPFVVETLSQSSTKSVKSLSRPSSVSARSEDDI
uniref:Uncharacterized protein n=1 Tax=Tetranychus urticae TaxID=32264 RepID=T1K0J0_TETUR